MICEDLARRLDAGFEPMATEVAHAAGCARCRPLLEAERALETALVSLAHAGVEPRFQDDFADRVVAGIARTEAARAAAQAAAIEPMLPWWVHAARDPACMLACAGLAILLAGDDRLADLGVRSGLALTGWESRAMDALLARIGSAPSEAALAAGMGLVDLALLAAAIPLFLWSQRAAHRALVRP